jgi:hypothetical protein
MAAPILRYVYLSTVMYLPSVVIAMFNTVTILLPVNAHIDVYSVAVYLLMLNYSPRLISKHMSVVLFEHVLCLLGKHLALNVNYC